MADSKLHLHYNPISLPSIPVKALLGIGKVEHETHTVFLIDKEVKAAFMKDVNELG